MLSISCALVFVGGEERRRRRRTFRRRWELEVLSSRVIESVAFNL